VGVAELSAGRVAWARDAEAGLLRALLSQLAGFVTLRRSVLILNAYYASR